MILFVQSFGLLSPGGTARIFRSLLTDAPFPFLSVCTCPVAPPPVLFAREVHLPVRSHAGIFERGRLSLYWYHVENLLQGRLEQQLLELAQKEKATGIHGHSHTMDFWSAFRVSQKLNIPFYLAVHDDLRFLMKYRNDLPAVLEKLGVVWREAKRRFVISEEIGQEYCVRYGERPYEIVTDGVEAWSPPRPVDFSSGLSVYFMGLYHNAYVQNVHALCEALAILQQKAVFPKIRFTMRCGALKQETINGFTVQTLPFGSESDVQEDMKSANLLYLPLHMDTKDADFYRFSLSTKMVTYLGSGLPILYHGAGDSAACRLLERHNAAILCKSLDAESIAQTISAPVDVNALVENAQQLGREQFDLQKIRARFWSLVAPTTELPLLYKR